jgi:hypothetical protein
MDQEKDKLMRDLTPEERQALYEDIEKETAPIIAKIKAWDREIIDSIIAQERAIIDDIIKNARPGDLAYFLNLWDKAVGENEDDAMDALWELAILYYSRRRTFPVIEERTFLEGKFFAQLDLYSEELRDIPRSRDKAWHEDLTIPSLQEILKNPKYDAIPLLTAIEDTRKLLRPAIRSDILSSNRPYGTREGKYFEDSEGRTSPVIDPTTEEGLKAQSRAYKYRFYPNVEKAFNPVRDIISDKLTLLGFDTEGLGNERLAYLSAEISKLKDHDATLLYTFMERDSLENYAQECGKSVSALYKQRERLKKRVLQNVQNAINKLDI